MPTIGGASCVAEMAGDMGKCATSEPALLTRRCFAGQDTAVIDAIEQGANAFRDAARSGPGAPRAYAASFSVTTGGLSTGLQLPPPKSSKIVLVAPQQGE